MDDNASITANDRRARLERTICFTRSYKIAIFASKNITTSWKINNWCRQEFIFRKIAKSLKNSSQIALVCINTKFEQLLLHFLLLSLFIFNFYQIKNKVSSKKKLFDILIERACFSFLQSDSFCVAWFYFVFNIQYEYFCFVLCSLFGTRCKRY